MIPRCLLALGLLACHAPAPDDVLDRTLLPVGPQALTAFELADTQGNALAPADLIGHWTLVVVGYTSCPDVCPSTLLGIGDALDRWSAQSKAIDALFVAVDPTHDAEVLPAYVHHFHASLRGATGSPSELNRAAAALGASFRIGATDDGSRRVDHSTSAFLVDPQGAVAAVHTRPSDGALLAEEVAGFVDAWSPATGFDGWIRRPPPGAGAAAGYGVLSNRTQHDRSIVGVSSPHAQSIHTHETVQGDGVAYMQPAVFSLPASDRLQLTPGAGHLMIGGLDPSAISADLRFALDDGTSFWARVPVRAR